MMPKVFFGIPIFRYFEPMAFKHLEKALLNRRSYDVGGYLEIYNESLIQRARNGIVKKFLETDNDYLFFLDSDIVILTPFAIDMLVEANKDIIAGAYVYKQYPVRPAFRLKDNDYNLTDKPDMVEALYVSSGFMLIKRDIVDKIYKYTSGYPFNAGCEEPPGKEFLSEDWKFCELAKYWFKVKAYIHTKIELAHLGIYPFTMKDFYRFQALDKKDLKDLDFNMGIVK
jgi:glycosyltransferase involved in cell wall biosynthesis